jgi:hypothetical protein
VGSTTRAPTSNRFITGSFAGRGLVGRRKP